jgi:hypothetical protein
MAKTPELEGISGSASEQDLILATKLYIPKTRRQYVNRDHLLKKLDQGLDSRLVLVSAFSSTFQTHRSLVWETCFTSVSSCPSVLQRLTLVVKSPQFWFYLM